MSAEYPAELYKVRGPRRGKRPGQVAMRLRFTGEQPPRTDEPTASAQDLTSEAQTAAQQLHPNTDGVLQVLVTLDDADRVERVRTRGRSQHVATPEPADPAEEPRLFRNPYNFVPFASREQVAPPLGDARPAGHDRYIPGGLSGRLTVEAVVATPLLLPGHSDGQHHPTFDARVRPTATGDGKPEPYISPTGIRGALRARYEALTNSRLGIVSEGLSRAPKRPRGQLPPVELLPVSLRQASDYEALSPAERVFGWVHADADRADWGGRVALRSSLRVGQVAVTPPTDGKGSLESAADRPLAILSSPKPSCGRFYVADSQGSPAGSGEKTEVGYREGNRLRGRKVYPHQPMADDLSWFDAGKAERPPWSGDRNRLGRTMRHWVRPGTRLAFSIDVRNLDPVELGALLVSLQPTEMGSHLRLGYGKPLGFGSVRVEQVEVRVEDGTRRRERLAGFDAGLPPTCGDAEVEGWRQAFLDALSDAFETSDAIVRAVRADAKGFDDKVLVTYPLDRLGRPGYRWFVENEKQQNRQSLPLLDVEHPYSNTRL